MIFLMLISLYTSRVVLATLGVTDFGIYNIVGGVVVLFSFLNNAMVSSIQRFLNIELGRKDEKQAGKVFSMSVNCQLIIIFFVLLLSETVGLWFLNTYLNIPPDRMEAANWIFQFSILSMCVGILYAPYNAAIIAYEKMSIYAYISILEAVLKLAIVYLLIIGSFDKLILFGFLILIVHVIVCLIYVYFCLKNFSICFYHKINDKAIFKSIMSFSGWSLFGSLASVGTTQGLNIVQNMFFGVAINAAMGVANQVNNALNQFVSNFSMAYRPQIIKYYAANDKEYFLKLVCRMSKFTYMLLFVLSLPVIICCDDILDIWLKDVPAYAVAFCRITIYYSLSEALTTPLWMAVQATGKIKKYQINISFLKLLALPISIIGLYFGASTEFVLWVNLLANISNHIYRLYYLKADKEVDLNIWEYTKTAMWPCLVVTILSLPIPIILQYFVEGYIGLTLVIITAFAVAAFVTMFLGLDKNERVKVYSFAISKIHKK